MIKSICVMAGLFVLTSVAHAADTPCEIKRYASLDVEIDNNGMVLVPVTIEGHEVWMILALNQGTPLLYSNVIEDLQLKTRNVDLEMTSRGKPVTRMATVNNITVGGAKFAGWDMYVMPANSQEAMLRGKPIVGALTSRFFGVVDLELNLAQNKINLFAQTRCKGGALYWGGEYTAVRLYVDPTGLLVFPMEVDTHVVETSFNTTSRDSMINGKVSKRYFGFDETSPDIQHERQGDREISSYRAMALTAKGLEIRNSKIRLIQGINCDPTTSERNTGAIGCGNLLNIAPFSIGTDLLKKLRVYIASKEGMVYFTRVEPNAEPASAPLAEPAPAPRGRRTIHPALAKP